MCTKADGLHFFLGNIRRTDSCLLLPFLLDTLQDRLLDFFRRYHRVATTEHYRPYFKQRVERDISEKGESRHRNDLPYPGRTHRIHHWHPDDLEANDRASPGP